MQGVLTLDIMAPLETMAARMWGRKGSPVLVPAHQALAAGLAQQLTVIPHFYDPKCPGEHAWYSGPHEGEEHADWHPCL